MCVTFTIFTLSIDLVFYFVDKILPDETPESIHLLPNDEIFVGLKRNMVENDVKEPVVQDNSDSLMSSQYSAFLNNSALSDVCFEFIEGTSTTKVYAHRVILSARSAYFKCMFTDGYNESNSSTIVIDHCSRLTFMCILEYIYTNDVAFFREFPQIVYANVPLSVRSVSDTVGACGGISSTVSMDSSTARPSYPMIVPETDSNLTAPDGAAPVDELKEAIDRIVQLLVCANRYMLADLQKKCELLLEGFGEQVVTKDNICELTHVCDTYSASILREACKNFIHNNLEFIQQNDQLRREIAESPELALLMVDAVSCPGNGNKRKRANIPLPDEITDSA